MSNPECFRHCPRILDAAERSAHLGRTGVVVAESVAKQSIEELLAECEAAAVSNCEGPSYREVAKKTTLLGRLGLASAEGSNVEYVCERTGLGRQEKRYLFKDV